MKKCKHSNVVMVLPAKVREALYGEGDRFLSMVYCSDCNKMFWQKKEGYVIDSTHQDSIMDAWRRVREANNGRANDHSQ